MRRGRTRQSRTGSTPQRHNGCHLGPTSAYAPLSEAEVDKVIDTAVMLLAESGVVFEPGTAADSLLCDAGCDLDGKGIVKIPQSVTRRALETVAKKTVLFDRNGRNPITIGPDHTVLCPA